MSVRLSRLGLVLLMPFMLVGCLLAPGKFTSTLTINADRTFTYTYNGEVYGFDMDAAMKDMPTDKKDGASLDKVAFQKAVGQKDDKKGKGDKDGDSEADKSAAKANNDAENRALAEKLSKETGFRKVEYVGNNKFLIDYSITGKLDHAFLFPYNLDAGIIIPFVAVELRANGTVRVKAPGFANEKDSTGGLGGMGPDTSKAASKLDGTFTLDTDAELVSQNNEDGAKTANGRTTVTWKANPTTATAPMAVVRFKDAPAK